jgi:formate hydrogenlyase transcriptional activator
MAKKAETINPALISSSLAEKSSSVANELMQERNAYRELLECVQAIVWRGNAQTFQFTFVSPYAEILLGYPVQHWLDEPNFWRDHIHPDDRESTVAFCAKVTDEKRSHEFDYRMIAADGQVVWLHDLVHVVVKNDQATELVGVMIDITQKQEAEEALAQSETRLRLTIDAIPQQIWSSPPEGSVDFANQRWRSYLGPGLEKLKGDGWQEILHPDDKQRVLKAWHESLTQGTPYEQEERHRRADGQYHWFLSRSVPLRDDQGRIVRWYGTNTDIEDRKRAEHALRDSEQRWRAVFENSTVGIALLDETGHFMVANSTYEEMVGRTSSELRLLKCRDLTYTEQDCVATETLIGELLERKRHRFELEKRYRRKDGAVIWVHASGSMVSETDGSPRFLIFLVADITQQKQAEHELRESEQRWHAVFANSNVGIALLDETARFLAVNTSYERMLGYPESELRLLTLRDIAYSEEDQTAAQQPFEELLQGKSQRFEVERRNRRKDGTVIWVRSSGSLVPAAEGRPLFLVLVVEDITERKRLFDQLALERDRLRLLLSVSLQIASHLNLGDLFNALATSLREMEGWEYSFVALPESADYLKIHLVGPGMGKPSVGTDLPVEGTFAGKAYRSGKPDFFRVADLRPVPGHPELTKWREFTRADGVQGGWNLPLLYDGEVLGVLGFHTRRDVDSARADLPFLEELARLVAIALHNALQYGKLSESHEKLSYQKNYLEAEFLRDRGIAGIVGASPAIAALVRQIDAVAPTDSTVLVTGETGTGKELVARAIHDRSPRRDNIFIKVDASAIPASLMESELFGYEKGAFTGATTQKMGRFEIADKGTLFLDEVGDLPLELQPKLLRVLQDQEFERLGSNRTRRLDVRIVAATNRNLSEMVEAGEFRSDLYYRLNVFPIWIPPLRQRSADIPLLVRYFVAKYAQRMKKRITEVPPEAMETFIRYTWPGNVRELQHFIERAVILTPGHVLRAPLAELKKAIPRLERTPEKSSPPRTMQEIERESVVQALRESKWVVGGPHGAAVKLGLKRTTLASKMEKLGISRRSR